MVSQIAINDLSSTPKYLQIVNHIVDGIRYKAIRQGEKLPSLYELCAELNVSKRTVERAYDHLKRHDIIGGVHGKGYYINCSEVVNSKRVLFLLNELSTHCKIVYNAFVSQLSSDTEGNVIPVDLFTYNHNCRIFEDVLLNHRSGYSHYVVVPQLDSESHKTKQLLEELPDEKLILLDKSVEGLRGGYGSVVQNIEKDLIESLNLALPLLSKYQALNLLVAPGNCEPDGIVKSFLAFCCANCFSANVVDNAAEVNVGDGNAYICLGDEDLLTLVGKVKRTSYQVGSQVGLIAYNETPLKEILLDGITVISTDFDRMGRSAAELIRRNERLRIENPCRLIIRQSL